MLLKQKQSRVVGYWWPLVSSACLVGMERYSVPVLLYVLAACVRIWQIWQSLANLLSLCGCYRPVLALRAREDLRYPWIVVTFSMGGRFLLRIVVSFM